MKTWLYPLVIILAVASCGGPGAGGDDDGDPATSSVTQDLSSIVTNGSFETGDYTGWTLFEGQQSGAADGCAQCGTWGIASNGQTISSGTPVFDFFDHTSFAFQTPGTNNAGSITYQATDGTKVALQIQTGGESHRMFQTIALPACQPVVKWDMAYNDHAGGFDPQEQIAVNIRNPSTDAILATPFVTTNGVDPLTVPTMTAFQADLTAFSGQTVRLDYDMEVFESFFDAAFDNIRVVCKGLGASPGTLDYGSINLGANKTLSTTITNSAQTAITISAFNLAPGPFVITSAPGLPLTLAPNASTSLSVKFTPTVTGTSTGSLTIVSNDPNGNTTLGLTGVGAGSPNLVLSTASLDFGSVQVGDTSAPQALTLSNTGPVALTVSSASVSPPFALALATPITIPPGAHVDTSVTFSPLVAGPAAQTLAIVSNDPASPATVSCTGTGTSPALSLSTPELDFADQRVGTTSGSQTVRATNTGVGAVTITFIGTTGEFLSSTSFGLPLTLQPGEHADLGVLFAPTSDGPQGGTLELDSTAASSPDTVLLSGTGIAGHISAPSPLNFGNQRVGTTGAQALTVTNTGTDTLTVTSIATTAPYADVDPTPFSLAPGDSRVLTVTFTPGALGSQPGTLTLTSDDPTSPSLVIDLQGVGVLGQLSIDPGAVNFGTQRVGTTSAQHVVTVTNVGTDTVTISAASLGGPFTLAPPALPLVLAPGTSTTFGVTFSPIVAGTANASLAIVSDAPSSPDVVPVSGTGIEPIVAVNPPALAFGTQRTGTTSTAKTFTIKNTGSADLNVSAVTATGPFTLAIATPFTLAPNAQATVGVQFAPAAPGPATGTVSIASDAKTNPTVSLTGTGIEPVLEISTVALAFGNQRVGTASAGQAITVSNTGTAPLNLASVAVPPQFTLAGAPVPSSILPGAHVTFLAAFAPTAEGPASGSISFAHDAPGSPAAVAVTGTGTAPGVTITPSLAFGDVRVGTTSGPKTVTISNSGTDAFVVSSISLVAPFARTAVTLPATIAPGGSLSFDVTFSPTARAAASSTISIATDTGFSSVSLTGRGVAPLISSGTSTLSYGNVAIDTASPLPLVLTNNGDADLTISALTLSGPQKGDYALVTPPALPVTVTAGTSLTVTVQLTPTAHGTRVAQLAVASDALGTPALDVTLTGSGTGAIAGVAPPALDLGAANVGDTTDVKSVTVTNTGETALVVSAVVMSGTDAADFATTASLPVTIAPGASAQVGFTLTPSAAGARSATATLQTNDPLTPASAVALTGSGTSPVISPSVSTLAFGDVRVGDSSTLPVTLTNTGTGPLTLTALTLAGTDAGEVSLSAVTLPLVLAPNGKKVVDVTFGPTTLGAASAKVIVTSDDPTTPALTLPITGNGVSPTVSISPASIDFGGQLVGRTTVPRLVTIGNPGTGALAVTGLTLSGSQATAYTLVDARVLPATIAPGGSLDIEVAFAPTAIAQHDATLTIATDSPDAPTGTVDLTGLGISTAMTVSPMSIDFGTVHAGTASAPTAVVVTNLSHDPIPLLDGVLAGVSAGDFQVSSAAGTVAPDGGTATVNVTYAPAAGASSTATLTLASSDPAIPQAVVVVNGRAVSAFLSADHPSLDFGSIEVGDRSGGKPVTITNTTTAPITVQSITAGTADFVVDATAATTTIGAGEHATFTVAFAPGSEGALATTVSVVLAGASTPELTVAVTGQGEAKPAGGCSAGGSGGGPLGALVALGVLIGTRSRRRR